MLNTLLHPAVPPFLDVLAEMHIACLDLGDFEAGTSAVIFIFFSDAAWIWLPGVLAGVDFSLLALFGDTQSKYQKPVLSCIPSRCSNSDCTCWLSLPALVHQEQGDMALHRAKTTSYPGYVPKEEPGA